MFRVRVGLWGKVASCIRCVASATCIRCVASASCIGIDVHAKIGVQIRCVGQVIVAPASRPVAYSLRKLGSGRKIEDCWKCSETLESLNICWNRCPFKNWGTNSLCRPSYCPSRLSTHGTWPIAYGSWVPVEKSRIVGNAPRLWSPLTFVGIEVHAKIGVQIHCVGQVIVLPASRPMARGLWPMAYGARVSVEKSRIVRNAPKLLSPSTFVGIDVHAKFGIQIRCVGQGFVVPASRPMARGLWPMEHAFRSKDRGLFGMLRNF